MHNIKVIIFRYHNDRFATLQSMDSHEFVVLNRYGIFSWCLCTAAAATFHVHSLVAIWDHLPKDIVRRLCASLVISRPDYCNSVLTGLLKCSLCPLQLALDMAARFVYIDRQ